MGAKDIFFHDKLETIPHGLWRRAGRLGSP